jgi:hypothetical protein
MLIAVSEKAHSCKFPPIPQLRIRQNHDVAARAMKNIYLDLTEEFNAGRLRAIISSGQAVVLHRLAIMSKDGDWILREEPEAISHVLEVLAARGARYRFGAPLDVRWMAGGWSAHFEFRHQELRVRTDFVTRPPRVNPEDLARLWTAELKPPVVPPATLAEIKKTNREKDYAVIGELARLMDNPRDQLLHSRSARDLLALAQTQPGLLAELSSARPLLLEASRGQPGLEEALDAERRRLIRANEERLAAYRDAAQRWAAAWLEIEKETRGWPLAAAHETITARAVELLPFRA